jgi:hypothetical protein
MGKITIPGPERLGALTEGGMCQNPGKLVQWFGTLHTAGVGISGLYDGKIASSGSEGNDDSWQRMMRIRSSTLKSWPKKPTSRIRI